MRKALKMSGGGIELRPLTAEDWEFVRSIYLEGIASGQATFETVAPSWEKWNIAHLPGPRLVAGSDKGIVGWAALIAVSTRTVYAGVAEVSVYVRKEWRGQRVGRVLLEALVEE